MFKLTDEDLKILQQIVLEQKMQELFEEPCTYEDEYEDGQFLNWYS